MKLSDGLKARLAEVLAKAKALLEAVEKSETKEFTEAQAKEFDDLEKETERLEGQIAQAERAEKLSAKANGVPAATPVGGNSDGRAEARPKQKLNAERKVALIMSAQMRGKLDGEHPFKVLDDAGYSDFVVELMETNGITKSVNTLTPAAGGVLIPPPARGELMQLLYPETSFLRGNPVPVPLVGGAYEQPFGVTGATAAYVGEGAKKPVSDLTFDKMAMKAKKLAGIVLITKEAQRWTLPNITNYVERNLRTALPLAMDTAAYLGTGVGDSPLGVLNKVGIGVYTATGRFADPKVPTIAELDRVATLMATHMTSRFIGQTARWAWIMSPRTINYLKDFRLGANLDLAFPDLQGATPVWKGIRVLVHYGMPENGGATTDETTLALVNFDDVLFGEEEGFNTSFSDQATVDVSGTLVHLWQQNMFGLLAEMMHDFGVQRGGSVVRLNNVRWGAP